MSSLSAIRPPSLPSSKPKPSWTVTLDGPLRGLVLAQESGHVLACDDDSVLHLLNRQGKLQARHQSPTELTKADLADNGSAIVTGSAKGDTWWLAPDLSARWHKSLGQKINAIALDSLGDYVAVSDASGKLSTYDREGELVWTTSLPRALHHLTFVPEKPFLLGSADLGLTVCFDFEGKQVWQDRLVTHVGGLAVNGDGDRLVLACFGDGLYRYKLSGPPPETLRVPEPCRRVAMSYDGEVMLAAGLHERMFFLDVQSQAQGELHLEAIVTHVQLGPLADHAVVGLTDGRLQYFQWN